MYKPKERFDILNGFIGWGNPKAGIWFVGIEEGGVWEAKNIDSEIKSKYDSKIGMDILSKSEMLALNDKLYKNISSILNNENIQNRENIENIFYANLFPLSVPNIERSTWESIFDSYKELFDLNNDEYNKINYYNRAKQNRFKIINGMYEFFKPRLVICHGSEINYFSECFNVSFEPKKYKINYTGKENGYQVCTDNTKKIVIVNHLSYPPHVKMFVDNHLNLIDEVFK